MIALAIGLIEPCAHALANILDEKISRSFESSLRVAVLLQAAFGVLFCPLLFFFGMPSLAIGASFWWLLGIAFCYQILMFPYFRAVLAEETSHIAAYFKLQFLVLPVMAFVLLGEQLALLQYLGIGLMLLGSIWLSAAPGQRFRVGRGLLWMLPVVVLLSLAEVGIKFVSDSLDWVTLTFWLQILGLAVALPLLLLPGVRAELRQSVGTVRAMLPIFSLNQLASFVGTAGMVATLALLPVTVANGIAGLQPFFVMLWSYLLQRFGVATFESLHRAALLRKIALHCLIFLGFGLLIFAGRGLS